VGQKIFNNQLKPAVGDWVWVQMAKRFVEKAAKPFDDRLREHDWNN
jgi:hypothetical protein